MKRTTGRGPKEKGKAFEREIVASILAAFPQLSPHDVLARSMGDPGVDVVLSEAARKVLPLAIECKRVGRVEDLDLAGAMDQAEAYRSVNQTPCVVYRENHHQAYAALYLGDLAFLAGFIEPDAVAGEGLLVTLYWMDLLKLLGGFK